jgi:hypothetical protein
MQGKPGVGELGIDLDAQTWQRSGNEHEAFEVAFVAALGQPWVLLRVDRDPAGRVLVYTRHEWLCFVDGAKGGEFDEAGSEGPRSL